MFLSNQVSITLCLLTITKIFKASSFIAVSNTLSKTMIKSFCSNCFHFSIKHFAINFISVLELI